MNYVIRYKDGNEYKYACIFGHSMEYVFIRSIVDAFFHVERKYAENGVEILKKKYPNLKFQILAV